MKQWTLGLMSGTSMDGIDVAAIQTDGLQAIGFGPTLFVPYPDAFKEKLNSILGSTERTSIIDEIEAQLTLYHVDAVKTLMVENSLSHDDIDAIGFHGHTILHQSPKKYPVGRTWQIGDAQMLADKTGIPVVGNLRENDVAHGGEGAPLVPIFQQALCKDLPKPLAIVNIGGIANIAWIDTYDLMAFDTGPGNALIDQWVQKHTGEPYDAGGKLASQGQIDSSILTSWLEHPYFSITPPKSLDRLDFSFSPDGLSLEDGAATLTAFTAESIIKGISHIPHSIFIAGGGRHNQFLMRYLQEKLSCPVKPIDILGWSSDFLESQAWAYLAKRSLKKLPITFPATTGIKEQLTGGISYQPKD